MTTGAGIGNGENGATIASNSASRATSAARRAGSGSLLIRRMNGENCGASGMDGGGDPVRAGVQFVRCLRQDTFLSVVLKPSRWGGRAAAERTAGEGP
jgi:hypothetical protein